MQKPITDAVALSSEENKKELESLRNTIEATPKNPKAQLSIHPLNVKQEVFGNKHVPSESNRFSWNEETFQKWKIGKTDGYVFIKKDDKQIVHNMDIRDYPETELTEGLSEILLNNAQNKNKIKPSDIQIWGRLLEEGQISTQYKTSNFYRDIVGLPALSRKSRAPSSSPRIEVLDDDDIPTTSGEGLACKNQNQNF